MYEISSKALPSRAKDLVGHDSRQQYVYKRNPNHLVRFSDYHPRTNTEAFFYNLLLSKVPFRNEASLISECNTTEGYMVECMLRDDPDRPIAGDPNRQFKKIIEDEDDLEEIVDEYCQRHMFR